MFAESNGRQTTVSIKNTFESIHCIFVNFIQKVKASVTKALSEKYNYRSYRDIAGPYVQISIFGININPFTAGAAYIRVFIFY